MKKVLIVDDDVDVRKFVSKLVERAGYEPIEAKNGIEGFDYSRCLDAETERNKDVPRIKDR
jgi:CheY-like chemotaxis protein